MKKKLFTSLVASLIILSSTLFASCCDPCVCWNGLYISGQLGGGWNHSHQKFTNDNYFNTLGPTLIGSNFSLSSSGFVGGGAIGYNFQCNSWVFGVEGGALYTDFKKSRNSPFFPTLNVFHYKVQWMANAKGRIGYACQCFLPFVTGGWAGSEVKVRFLDETAGILATSQKWVNGWTVGGGIDYMAFCHLSIGVEYDYNHMEYKHVKTSCSTCGTGIGLGTPSIDNSLRTHLLFARINFHL